MPEVDKSYRKNLHRKLDNYIDAEIISKKNKAKEWYYGFHPIEDMVVISKDGTIGDIIEINNLIIALPSVPDKIRWEGLRPEHQKWERYEVPTDLTDFDTIYADESNIEDALDSVFTKHEKFIVADHDKIRNGDWFYNDGEPIYITGGHYFFLQHYRLTDGDFYPDFRMPQRDYYIWLEACYADERSLGSWLLKSRRSSFTVTASSEIDRDAITRVNGFYPVTSKTEKDVDDLFLKHIVTPLIKLPKHLQPERDGNVMPKKELHFISKQRRFSVKNKVSNSNIGLNSRIKSFNATPTAYDGTQATKSLNDETPKAEFDINEWWYQAHKMCHEVGADVVGKCIGGSTAPKPMNGGIEYRQFFEDSNVENRNSIGRTKTGLYGIFIPADLSYKGYFDEWGYVIYYDPNTPVKNEFGKIRHNGVKSYLDAKEADYIDDTKAYNSQKRNEPRCAEDAFLDEDGESMFGKPSVVENKNFLRVFEKNEKFKEKFYSIDLFWTDGKPDTTVYHKINRNGTFIVGWLPKKEDRNTFIIKNGKKYPTNGHVGCFGCDPYRTSKVANGSGSKQAFVGLTKSEGDGFPKDTFFLYFNSRKGALEDNVEEIIKALVFFSMPILCEGNVNIVLQKLKERGYRGYSITDPTLKKSDLKPSDIEFGGQISSPRSVPLQELALDSWIDTKLSGDINEDDIKVPFREILEDWEKYTPDNRKKRDTTIATMMAIIGNQSKYKKPETETADDDSENLLELFEVKQYAS